MPRHSGVSLRRDNGIKRKMYFIYILRSLKDNGFYVGQTHNLERRLISHNNCQVKSTKSRTPLILIRKEEYNTRGEARKREIYLKKLKGGNEFKKIIELIELIN